MKKSDLVRAVSHSTGATEAVVAEIINAATGLIVETVEEGGTVMLTGFGRFESKVYAKRERKLFGQDKLVKLDERKVIKFKPSRVISKRINTEA